MNYHVLPKKLQTQAIIFVVVALGLLGATGIFVAHGRVNPRRPNLSSRVTTATSEQGARGLGENGTRDRGAGEGEYPPDPCTLPYVTCGSESERATITAYNLASYATHPQHLARLQAIYEAIPDIGSSESAESYIRSRYPESPVTGEMAWQASKAHDVDIRLLLALMQQDSSFGTAGKGARTCNPGNVGNDDAGNERDYCEEGWSAGVDAVAKWLENNKS